MKLKQLIPSLKEKRRYVAFEVISKKGLSFNEVKESIIKRYKEFFGIIGLSKASIEVLNEWKDNKGIIKVNNKNLDELKSSLVLIKTINNQKVIVRCIGVSGIIKKLKNKYMEG